MWIRPAHSSRPGLLHAVVRRPSCRARWSGNWERRRLSDRRCIHGRWCESLATLAQDWVDLARTMTFCLPLRDRMHLRLWPTSMRTALSAYHGRLQSNGLGSGEVMLGRGRPHGTGSRRRRGTNLSRLARHSGPCTAPDREDLCVSWRDSEERGRCRNTIESGMRGAPTRC